MIVVTYGALCLIYALMHDDISINVSAIIFSTIKMAHYNKGHKNRFG